ncbi:hypothetical protein [Ellagibacter isourolithinifaciens]|uniref:hypothetical protein n=1 Tax=Ellagibacter isourolithinifaciens TaxID=2137581 RepID=UPI003AABEE59
MQSRKLVYYLAITKIRNLEVIMSFQNIKAEMVREGVTYGDAAKLLGMSQNNFGLKVNERIAMTVDEVKKIQSAFFPTASLDYLCQSDGDKPSETERDLAGVSRFEESMKELGLFDGRAEAMAVAVRAKLGATQPDAQV